MIGTPESLQHIVRQATRFGLPTGCSDYTGRFLCALASSKPGGRILELGTGAGASTAWLASGLNGPGAQLTSVDHDPEASAVARRFVRDARVRFLTDDIVTVLGTYERASVDLIYSDAYAGRFSHVDETLELLAPGGIFVVDDMPPFDGALGDIDRMKFILYATLLHRADFTVVTIRDGTGIVMAVRR